MARIWANRLEAGDQAWNGVPDRRKEQVKEILRADVGLRVISEERYMSITGEPL